MGAVQTSAGCRLRIALRLYNPFTDYIVNKMIYCWILHQHLFERCKGTQKKNNLQVFCRFFLNIFFEGDRLAVYFSGVSFSSFLFIRASLIRFSRFPYFLLFISKTTLKICISKTTLKSLFFIFINFICTYH